MRQRRHIAGFTLVELLTTVAVSGLVLTSIMGTFLAQAQQYQTHAGRRGVQASARTALNMMERELRRASYGMDPVRAFMAYDSYDAVTNARIDNYPDAITFHARDPEFSRLASATINDLTLTVPLEEIIQPGQIFQVMCPGARVFAYVTAAASAAAGETRIVLGNPGDLESPVSWPGARFDESARLDGATPGQSCLAAAGNVIVMKVNRYSYFIQAFDDDNIPSTPPTPYLMVHRGIDMNGDGRVTLEDAAPVAAGIEQLQVAYVMNSIDGTPPLILGVDDSVEAPPRYGDQWALDFPTPPIDSLHNHIDRLNANPANVRQVRVTLVARSLVSVQQLPGDSVYEPAEAYAVGDDLESGMPEWQQLENCDPTNTPFLPSGGHYLRSVARMSIATKNMLTRAMFLPRQMPTVAIGGGG